MRCFRAKVGKPGPQRSTLDRTGVRADTAGSPAHVVGSERSPAEWGCRWEDAISAERRAAAREAQGGRLRSGDI